MDLSNFDNIPDQMISGLDCEELQWVTMESNEREIYEISGSFLSMLNDLDDSNELSTEFQDEISKELNQINLDLEMNIIDLDGEIQKELKTIEDESILTSSKNKCIMQ